MKTDLLSTRINHDLKVEFSNICDDLGMSPSQAIKIFAKAVINHRGIPFELKIKQPNTITVQAIEELENNQGHRAKDTSTLFSDLGVDI
jgi:DNA-damage-inducible protein J